MIEPVQGEGGIRAVPDSCLKGLRDLCDETGALLIFDEVQCGMGRTGRLFAHEWAGITPDIMMVAKGIGGGFPLGAVLATERAAAGMVAGTHGSTYGGNPLACAVGAAVMEIVSDDAFLAEVNRKRPCSARGWRGWSPATPPCSRPCGARPDAGPEMPRATPTWSRRAMPNHLLTVACRRQRDAPAAGADHHVEDITEALARLDRAATALEAA